MIVAVCRTSPLARAQLKEVEKETGLVFHPMWIESAGDKDRRTSLRDLGATDFFTKELDEKVLSGEARIAIHSAKDLPEKIPEGLVIAALTQGVDSRDSLVMRPGFSIETLPLKGIIGVSSIRREDVLKSIRPDWVFRDIRGWISERLSLLEQKIVDGVVVAEAALIRLNLTHLNRSYLPGDGAFLQGRLAVMCREDDQEMRSLFAALSRP